jgi:hypothetical protein
VCCAALLAVLPDLAWGVGGRVVPVHYPQGWPAAAAAINADPRPVAVLPAGSMRRFDWAGDAPVLDPLPRWVRTEVLTTGDLTIGAHTVPGEGRRAREVQKLLERGASREELARAGVGWVVVESADGDPALYRVGGDRPASPYRRVLIGAHLVWLALLAAGLAGMGVTALALRFRGSHSDTVGA